MSFSAGFAAGIAVGKKKWGGGKPSDDWQPPDFPEPQDNQIVMLVNILTERVGLPALIFALSNNQGLWTYGTGNEFVDWGDGYTDYSVNNINACFTHCYSQAGWYIITINLTPETIDYENYTGSNCIGLLTRTYTTADTVILSGGYNAEDFLNYTVSPYQNALRAIKIGKNVGMTSYMSSTAFNVGYIKYYGKPLYKMGFANCQGLIRLDFNVYPKSNDFLSTPFRQTSLQKMNFFAKSKILDSSIFSGTSCIKSVDLTDLEELSGSNTLFTNNYAITDLYLPNLTRIDGTFRIAQNCPALTTVYAPNITSIEQNDFVGCYALRNLILADNCNYNGNTFSTCYSLYPKPGELAN